MRADKFMCMVSMVSIYGRYYDVKFKHGEINFHLDYHNKPATDIQMSEHWSLIPLPIMDFTSEENVQDSNQINTSEKQFYVAEEALAELVGNQVLRTYSYSSSFISVFSRWIFPC